MLVEGLPERLSLSTDIRSFLSEPVLNLHNTHRFTAKGLLNLPDSFRVHVTEFFDKIWYNNISWFGQSLKKAEEGKASSE